MQSIIWHKQIITVYRKGSNYFPFTFAGNKLFIMASKFSIFIGSNSRYYFNLKAANGEIILASQAYTYKSSCQNGIQSVRENAVIESRYEKRISANGKYYFVLTAGNGQIIGTSEMYESANGRDNGINCVKKEAPVAVIEDYS